MAVHEIHHPLIQHKIGLMREQGTSKRGRQPINL